MPTLMIVPEIGVLTALTVAPDVPKTRVVHGLRSVPESRLLTALSMSARLLWNLVCSKQSCSTGRRFARDGAPDDVLPGQLDVAGEKDSAD